MRASSDTLLARSIDRAVGLSICIGLIFLCLKAIDSYNGWRTTLSRDFWRAHLPPAMKDARVVYEVQRCIGCFMPSGAGFAIVVFEVPKPLVTDLDNGNDNWLRQTPKRWQNGGSTPVYLITDEQAECFELTNEYLMKAYDLAVDGWAIALVNEARCTSGNYHAQLPGHSHALLVPNKARMVFFSDDPI